MMDNFIMDIIVDMELNIMIKGKKNLMEFSKMVT